MLQKEIKNNRKYYNLLLIIAFLSTVSSLINSLGLAIIMGLSGNETTKILQPLFFVGVSFTLISIIISTITSILNVNVITSNMNNIKYQFFQRILNQSYSDITLIGNDTYKSMLLTDIPKIEKQYIDKLIKLHSVKFSIISGIVFLLFFDVVLVLILTTIIFFFVLAYFLVKKLSIKYLEDLSKADIQYSNKITNILYGIDEIKVSGNEKKFIDVVEESSNKQLKAQYRYDVTNKILTILTDQFSTITQILIYIYIAYALVNNNLSIPLAVIVISVLKFIISSIISAFDCVKDTKSIEHLIDKHYNSLKDIKVEEEKNFIFDNEIQLKNVQLKYDERIILNEFNLSFEVNKKYLIKGESGSGKSSLLNAITKTNQNYTGEILVDNVNIKDINEKDFYNKIAIIPQKTFIFNDTLKNNITLFNEADDEEVFKILKQVSLVDFANSLDNSINTIIEENGINMSGGEKRRVDIARALYKKSKIIFADEMNSSLSIEVAREIEALISSLDITFISISHNENIEINTYDYLIELVAGTIKKTNVKEIN